MSAKDSLTNKAPVRPATELQSIAEIAALAKRPDTVRENIDVADRSGNASRIFRPSRRPPFPILRIIDDGQRSAELIRIRCSPFVIGRLEGQVIIPLDNEISARHAELSLSDLHGQQLWRLRDLGSTNGTFVRVARALLIPGQALLLGSRRYSFEIGDLPSEAPCQHSLDTAKTTREWHVVSMQPSSITPMLQERSLTGEVNSYQLVRDENWIGRDGSNCNLTIDDPLIDPKHARIFRDDRGRWHIEDAKSLNGVWVQVEEVLLGRGGFFQCGEQRFLFELR